MWCSNIFENVKFAFLFWYSNRKQYCFSIACPQGELSGGVYFADLTWHYYLTVLRVDPFGMTNLPWGPLVKQHVHAESLGLVQVNRVEDHVRSLYATKLSRGTPCHDNQTLIAQWLIHSSIKSKGCYWGPPVYQPLDETQPHCIDSVCGLVRLVPCKQMNWQLAWCHFLMNGLVKKTYRVSQKTCNVFKCY